MPNISRRFSTALLLILFSLLLVSGCGSKPNPALNLGGIDIEEVFNGQIKRVRQIMGGINTMDSVDKALPELQAVSMNFDDLIYNSEKLSEEGQTALSLLAVKAAPEMESLVRQVESSPVTRDALGGTMKEIFEKVRQLI